MELKSNKKTFSYSDWLTKLKSMVDAKQINLLTMADLKDCDKISKNIPNVVIRHDLDMQTGNIFKVNYDIDTARKLLNILYAEKALGLVSTTYIQRYFVIPDNDFSNQFVFALKNFESDGFEIGYHINDMCEAELQLKGNPINDIIMCGEILYHDHITELQKVFNIRTASAHGYGKRYVEPNNLTIEHQLKHDDEVSGFKNIVISLINKGISVAYHTDSFMFTDYNTTFDPITMLDNLKANVCGTVCIFLFHPQLYDITS